MLRATAEACKMFGQDQPNRNDYYEAAQQVEEAANIAEHGNPNE